MGCKMATEQQRASVLIAVERKQNDPTYEFSPDEIEAIRAVLDAHFDDDKRLPPPSTMLH